MQGESALAYLLICPQYLEEEFVVLEAVGMSWLACDMPGLTSAERTRRGRERHALLV